MRLRTSEIAVATGGRLDGPDVAVHSASIDSRTVRPGQLFVPIVAERDGHDYVRAALDAGASAYLTARPPEGGTAVVVDDTSTALAAAGRLARSRLVERVVGVTGSVGKTTVKDLLAAVLATRWSTAASERSFNNELGVPLTLLGVPDDTDAVVVEMGARGAGHIAELCAIAQPTMGVVTRVAAAHTEVFGTIDDVAAAKGELVEALPESGVAVLNAADPRVVAMAGRTAAEVVTFGDGGDVAAEAVVVGADLRARFVLHSPWGSADIALLVAGAHQVENALAAAAAGLALGVDPAAVAGGLAGAVVSRWRMEVAISASGAVVINDAYNANPTSMAAALRSLAAVGAERRTAVLGVMAELGATSDADHASVAALADDLGIRVIAVAAPAYGGELVTDSEAALDLLGPLGPDDAVLVKGSRVAGLERVAKLLLSR